MFAGYRVFLNFFFLTGFTGLMGFFSPAARYPWAEGPSIQTIL
jgi:hypothetical protein